MSEGVSQSRRFIDSKNCFLAILLELAGVCRHFRHVPSSVPLLSQPIGTLRLGVWVPGIAEPGSRPLHILRRDEPLSRALALLLEGTTIYTSLNVILMLA